MSSPEATRIKCNRTHTQKNIRCGKERESRWGAEVDEEKDVEKCRLSRKI